MISNWLHEWICSDRGRGWLECKRVAPSLGHLTYYSIEEVRLAWLCNTYYNYYIYQFLLHIYAFEEGTTLQLLGILHQKNCLHEHETLTPRFSAVRMSLWRLVYVPTVRLQYIARLSGNCVVPPAFVIHTNGSFDILMEVDMQQQACCEGLVHDSFTKGHSQMTP